MVNGYVCVHVTLVVVCPNISTSLHSTVFLTSFRRILALLSFLRTRSVAEHLWCTYGTAVVWNPAGGIKQRFVVDIELNVVPCGCKPMRLPFEFCFFFSTTEAAGGSRSVVSQWWTLRPPMEPQASTKPFYKSVCPLNFKSCKFTKVDIFTQQGNFLFDQIANGNTGILNEGLLKHAVFFVEFFHFSRHDLFNDVVRFS